MQKLVALKRLYYNRRDYDVGEKFEADDRFAKAVVLIGKAKVDDSKPTKASAPAPMPTPPPPAPPPLDTNSAADLVPNKRRYNRRDMAATEDGEESS